MAFSTTPSAGNDRLRATTDNQTINALAGNDWLRSTFNASTLYGGLGHDRITVLLNLPEPTETDNARSATLYGGNGNDWLVTEFVGAVTETEDSGAIVFGLDVLQSGGRGNDTLYVSASASSFSEFDVGTYVINLNGGAGDDNIGIETNGTGGWATNYVDGGTGSDVIYIYAAAGINIGSAGGNNEVDGGTGDDDVTVFSQDGENILRGQEGNDRLDASTLGLRGFNNLSGGEGDDVLIADSTAGGDSGGWAQNLVSGGDGYDTIEILGLCYGATANVENEAYGDAGDDTITSVADLRDDGVSGGTFGTATTLLYGGTGNDTMTATVRIGDNVEASGSSTLYGGAGDDILRVNGDVETTLNGGAGNDTITGGSGNDRIIGGSGADLLRSGGGEDAFVYLWTTGVDVATRDTIRGFGFGDDVIDLSAIDANANQRGNQTFTFGGGTGVGRAWVEDSATGTGSIIRANNGGAEQLYIAVEDGTGRDASDWSADDFLL